MRKEIMGDGKSDKVTKTAEVDEERKDGDGENDKVTKTGEEDKEREDGRQRELYGDKDREGG